MRMKVLIPLLFVLVLFSRSCYSQAPEKNVEVREQLWLGYFNQTRFSNKFGAWFDIHYRLTGDFVDRPTLFMVRPGITYYINNSLRFHTGYAWIKNYPPEGLSTDRVEHRIWQQIWWSQQYSGFSTLQWLRFEERFSEQVVNDEKQDGYTYGFRLRYNVGFFVPFKGKQIVPGSLFAAVINELFLNFGGEVIYNTFDQNRFFAGLGYQINPKLNVQLGYLNVFQQLSSGNNYVSVQGIRVAAFHNLDLRNSAD